jgi:Nucleotidyl transferase AbiEii toxin, Type IV TA system
VTLAERLLAIHRALEEARIEHAFGGAIALAYWTLEPRGTRDIDVNLFVPPDDCEAALAALPAGISYEERDVARIKRDGQIRLWWDDTPVDLFFSNLAIHRAAARHRQRVRFEGEEIPVLGPVELAVFKAVFDRTRDWADIEAMLEAGTLDADAMRECLVELVGISDQRLNRLDETLRRTGPSAD